jgi:nucleotidyltransferase substrate binding protein (TIGR01987 family)
MSSEKILKSVENLEQALSRLDEYCSLPVQHDRDKAGIIQAFEFTFEIFWKTFKKIAESEGLESPSPKASISAAFQMNLITNNEEATWLSMLKNRNLTTHTYKKQISDEIYLNTVNHYLNAFEVCRQRIDEKVKRDRR